VRGNPLVYAFAGGKPDFPFPDNSDRSTKGERVMRIASSISRLLGPATLLFALCVGPVASCGGGAGDPATGEVNQAELIPCVCPKGPNGRYPASCSSARCTAEVNPCMVINCVGVNNQVGAGHCAANGPWQPDGTPCGGTSTCQSGVCTP
jgi:hypothetical protein